MRIAVVYFSHNELGRIHKVAKAYADGVSKQGHEVTLINGFKNDRNLFIYDSLFLGVEPATFLSGKIDISVQHRLQNLGHIEGKTCYAFILKNGLWANRSMQLWMKWLESCGLMLLLSDIVVKPSEARLIGKRINIYK